MVLSLELTKEATYLFEYKGLTKSVDVYVDSVEGRRYLTKDVTGSVNYDARTGADLNYKGTGNPYSEIKAELISETDLTDSKDFGYKSFEYHRLMFLLPDVNAYAVGSYDFFDPMGAGDPNDFITELSIRLLDKI